MRAIVQGEGVALGGVPQTETLKSLHLIPPEGVPPIEVVLPP